MTAVIHHGPPGSYKSFGVLQDEVIPALKAGRTVVTNVRGLDAIERIEAALNIEIPEQARLISVPHDAEGFETMSIWFHWAPKGALIFMDEGQRIYPTRLKSLAGFDYPGGIEQAEQDTRPATLEDAFDQHRHHNWDIYITTTNIAKIHKEIRQVCEYGFRHRNLTGLLPWYKNKWKEVKHDPSNSGQSTSHCISQPIHKTADTRCFDCYQSTQTGEATNDVKNQSVFKQPKLLVFMAILVIGIFYQIWFWFVDGNNYDSEIRETENLASSPAVTGAAGDGGIWQYRDTNALGGSASGVALSHPVFHQKGQYLGFIKQGKRSEYLFRFYDQDERFYEVTSNDLASFGIEVMIVGCVAKLSYGDHYRFINCYNQVPSERIESKPEPEPVPLIQQPIEPPSRLEWLETQPYELNF